MPFTFTDVAWAAPTVQRMDAAALKQWQDAPYYSITRETGINASKPQILSVTNSNGDNVAYTYINAQPDNSVTEPEAWDPKYINDGKFLPYGGSFCTYDKTYSDAVGFLKLQDPISTTGKKIIIKLRYANAGFVREDGIAKPCGADVTVTLTRASQTTDRYEGDTLDHHSKPFIYVASNLVFGWRFYAFTQAVVRIEPFYKGQPNNKVTIPVGKAVIGAGSLNPYWWDSMNGTVTMPYSTQTGDRLAHAIKQCERLVVTNGVAKVVTPAYKTTPQAIQDANSSYLRVEESDGQYYVFGIQDYDDISIEDKIGAPGYTKLFAQLNRSDSKLELTFQTTTAGSVYDSSGWHLGDTGTAWLTPSTMVLGKVRPTPPVKTVSAASVNALSPVVFSVSQLMESVGKSSSTRISSLSFKDPLPDNVTYESAKMYKIVAGEETDVTSSAGTLSYNSSTRTVEYAFSSSWLANESKSQIGETYKLVINCRAGKTGATFDPAVKKTNTASVTADGLVQSSSADITVASGVKKEAITKEVYL